MSGNNKSTETKNKNNNIIPKETLLGFIPEGYQYDKIFTKALNDSPWNDKIFSKVTDDKLLDLMASIQETGLQQPIVVRAIGNNKYEILAGHTRRRAYEMLYAETKQEKYLSIEAFVYEEGIISDEQAKDIIVDTNLFNRGGLPVGDQARCIAYKAEQIKKYSKYGSGNINQQLADKLDVSSAFIKDMRAISKLNNEIIELIINGKITQKSAVKLSVLSKEDQDIICNEYLDKLDNIIINRCSSPISGEIITADKIIKAINKAQEINETVSITKKCNKSQFDKSQHQAIMIIIDKKDKKRQKELLKLLADNGFDNVVK